MKTNSDKLAIDYIQKKEDRMSRMVISKYGKETSVAGVKLHLDKDGELRFELLSNDGATHEEVLQDIKDAMEMRSTNSMSVGCGCYANRPFKLMGIEPVETDKK